MPAAPKIVDNEESDDSDDMPELKEGDAGDTSDEKKSRSETKARKVIIVLVSRTYFCSISMEVTEYLGRIRDCFS